MPDRRDLLKLGFGAALAGGISTILPYRALADSHGMDADSFETNSGKLVIRPVSHASLVIETPGGVIYADPVGAADRYSALPAPDLILVTHEHGDHYNADTLAAITGEDTKLITNPAVFAMLPGTLKPKATAIANGETTTFGDIAIDAIPAYNTTEGRLQYHPRGRDNGYVLGIDGRRVYIAGDTEDIPEMRALENIDIAFLPMLLPYTMDIGQAASAVEAFKPAYVYPYHYRDSDIDRFAEMVASGASGSKVQRAAWYG